MGTKQDPVEAKQEQERQEQEQARQQAALQKNASASDDAQRQMMEEANNAGVAAFSFDPDASPEEKRAQARSVSFTILLPPRPLAPRCHALTL
jgi:hypothetical protein